ncbi:MAG: hypothetical protein KGH67_01555 [Candidatus Micrarchaeota archaeon]|nr:hypothetical protein [Candidatus Micrarchaeota archaeon]MDE1859192.1 hypothetical protein [Candidatus Micrarchaeota archaeon]
MMDEPTETQKQRLRELGLSDADIAALPTTREAQNRILELSRPDGKLQAEKMQKAKDEFKDNMKQLHDAEEERLKAEAERKAKLESTRKPKPKPGDDDYDEDEENDDFNEADLDDESDDFDDEPNDDE